MQLVGQLLMQFNKAAILGDNGKQVSVVKVKFSMDHPVEDSIYNYIIEAG